MIAVECRGRLGNQMFQYAFGLAAAQLLGTTLKIDDAELRRLFVLVPACNVGEQAPDHVVTVANDAYEEPAEVLERLADETTYVGYFQSEEFFRSIAPAVRSAFRLHDEHIPAFGSLYPDLAGRDYVCCHMRRTDYHKPRGMPMVFVGDDLDEARESFRNFAGARFERNDEATDLQLLRHASSVVVSNSTFAWWGAWLNEQPGARTVAPRHWLGFDFGWEYPPRVIPPGWARVRVKRPWSRRLSPAHVRMMLGHRRRAASRARRRAPSGRAA